MRKNLQVFIFTFLIWTTVTSCNRAVSDVENERAGMSNYTAPVATTQTTVYFVRHAEKESSNPNDQNPDLTPEGKARAEALRALMQEVELGALYATKFIRTKNTLMPLSNERNLPIAEYKANDFTGLRQRVLEENSGKTVLVAAHSNTLLPLLNAFGAKTTINFIPETEYSYLFKVTLLPDNTTKLEVNNYN
ncbi:histidine phosphatase family protein [Pontibacter qinzhouensis]|uniref:Histidine phosphatase family protein n=1 Tax=Pontibacter qinzhouensis TaxID=2603253 RepID=A0A5C8KC70_9BACT|nr:histidine phosphatase family protein [Pontibacter qinzhouensis]TXK52072.1 histidine phosphatase family protein [Pontibacter qinzhouensis]